MAVYTVRAVQTSEIGEAARMKADYVRSLYRGFLSPEYLRQIDENYYVSQIREWLSSGLYWVDMLDVDGKAEGFIVYGEDTSCPGCGLIYEQALNPICSLPEKNTLVQHALEQLKSKGMREIHLWVLWDNFCMRFLYESLGFRADGMTMKEQLDTMELCLARYTYIIPEN